MEEIIEVKKLLEFKEFLSLVSTKELGHGGEGTVYPLANNKVIKILNGDYQCNYDYTIEDYIRFSKLETEYIYFAKQVYVYQDDVLAATYQRCPGENLMRIDPLEIGLSDFIGGYQKLEKEIITLSNKSILFEEVFQNCMYDQNHLGLVDTTGYNFSDMDEKKILNINLCFVQRECTEFLIDPCLMTYIKNYPKLYQAYQEIMNENSIPYVDFLQNLKTSICHDCGKRINKLKYAQKILAKTK